MSRTPSRRGTGHERSYRLVHRTSYTYRAAVTTSYGLAMLLPREWSGQRVHQASLTFLPGAAETAEHRDLHGNRVSYFQITAEHTSLDVVASSVVTITRRPLDLANTVQVPWERAVASVSGMRATGQGEQGEGPTAVLAVVESALPSELVLPDEAVREYAMPSFGPTTALVRVVAELAGRIHRDVPEAPIGDGSAGAGNGLAGDGGGSATPSHVLARRFGSSADRAHLLVASLRSMGLAARYVAGYVARGVDVGGADGPHDRADGPHDRADGHHDGPDAATGGCVRSWAAVWLPGGGWVHVDPTGARFIDNRYIVLGWGRDQADVQPLRGVVYGGDAGSPAEELELEVVPSPAS
ncbi:transglutaminase family protein [Georgenia yuyongxinii]|uniref:Transglutaminase family protein n=1 Tax=Georgenia yuyongxinii TaxID=2589797 RepID=A0A5B8C848_9MICO|nr:transglutaminase family protein [Georgenia yuyongxinii]QDC26210.1 transglutaminase family protein [Georgenia yuyongxinii]